MPATVYWTRARKKVKPERRDFITKIADNSGDFFVNKGIEAHEVPYLLKQLQTFMDIYLRKKG